VQLPRNRDLTRGFDLKFLSDQSLLRDSDVGTSSALIIPCVADSFGNCRKDLVLALGRRTAADLFSILPQGPKWKLQSKRLSVTPVMLLSDLTSTKWPDLKSNANPINIIDWHGNNVYDWCMTLRLTCVEV
jgi:hypothetical protein